MSQTAEKLLINPVTYGQIEAFYSHPANALLIAGRPGSGKTSLAYHLAAKLLGTTASELENQPYFMLIEKPAGKTEIPIDLVRDLIVKTSLKVPHESVNKGGINRIALITDAGFMSNEAQNALLKLLEEPPAGTLLVLTADSPENLLTTIVSRVQTIRVVPPNLKQSLSYFDKHSSQAITSAWELSRGSPGLLSALLSEQDSHPLKAGVADAKRFLGLNTYQKLIELQEISKDKVRFRLFLEALARVLSALHTESIKSNKQKSSARLLAARRAVESALTHSNDNANQRLVYLALVLNTPL